MKKILMALLCLAFCQFSYALPTTNNLRVTEVKTIELKKLELQDLPLEVKKSLRKDEYKDWIVTAAMVFINMDIYMVELKSGNHVKVIRFDCEGNKIVANSGS